MFPVIVFETKNRSIIETPCLVFLLLTCFSLEILKILKMCHPLSYSKKHETLSISINIFLQPNFSNFKTMRCQNMLLHQCDIMYITKIFLKYILCSSLWNLHVDLYFFFPFSFVFFSFVLVKCFFCY